MYTCVCYTHMCIDEHDHVRTCFDEEMLINENWIYYSSNTAAVEKVYHLQGRCQ